MSRKFPVKPAHPERICWGCDQYCSIDALKCGNGSLATLHPSELFGEDWQTWGQEAQPARPPHDERDARPKALRQAMKLNILSDLHLGFDGMEGPVTDADLVVLAGDIARPRQAVAWALRLGKPVLYVPGNHEFYGGSLDGALRELQQLCQGTQVQVLDRGERIIDGVRFLGAMLWSDFRLFPGQEEQAKAQARELVRDFSRIRLREDGEALFTPDDCIALFARDSAWLQERLNTPFDGPTVVITHHAPTRQSVHPRFADSLLSACFVSDAAQLLGGERVQLWIHGHTHDSFDYDCKGTRVVCNPRGYCRAGVTENQAFDPRLVLRVGAPGAHGAPAAGAARAGAD